MILQTAAMSEIGLRRNHNEDRYLMDDRTGLYGVADGIGGLPCGAEAAARTVEVISEYLKGLPSAKRPGKLYDAILLANQEVYELGRKLSPHRGIGTTLTFGCATGSMLCIAHVGDSRCYFLHKGRLELLTTDHNVENESKARRARGEAVPSYAPNPAALTRCVGLAEEPLPDLFTVELSPGDRVLFCTDGITRLLSDAEIEQILITETKPVEALEEMIRLTLERGGLDNATGVLLQSQ